MPYVKPQVLTFQEFVTLPVGTQTAQNTLIIGEHYSLRRATEPSEKSLTDVGPYTSVDATYDYPNQVSGSDVDTSFVKLYTELALATYFNADSSVAAPITSANEASGNRITVASPINTVTASSGAVATVTPSGFYTGGSNLPRVYNMWPQADFILGTEPGVMSYETSDGATGTFDVPSDATVAGVLVEGPNGLLLDFDTPGALPGDKTYTVRGASGAKFDITYKVGSVDAHRTSPFNVNITDATIGATYTSGTNTLDLPVDSAAGSSLSAILADLLSVTDAAVMQQYIEISEIYGGAGTGAEALTVEVNGSAEALPSNTVAIEEIHGTIVSQGDLVFASNDYATRSASIPRDVKVGDYLEYTVTPASTGVEVTSTSKVIAVEASPQSSTIGTPEASFIADNQHGDDLSAGLALITSGGDNQSTFDTITVNSLSATNDYATPNLSTGTGSYNATITVTTAGAAGTAAVSVSRPDGYFATNVPVVVGSNDGTVYIGDNMYVDFTAGGGDGIFRVGDYYTTSTAIEAITGLTDYDVKGFYGGNANTTYILEITQGGRYSQAADVTNGIQTTAGITLNTDLGTYNRLTATEEYTLTCSTAGSISTARFDLDSAFFSDNASNIAFGALDTLRTVGSAGLKLSMSHAGTPSFAVGDSWVIRLDAINPRVSIYDTLNSDTRSSVIVVPGNEIPLGTSGLTVTFNEVNLSGLFTGSQINIPVTASADGPINTLVLADTVPADVQSGVNSDGTTSNAYDTFDIKGLIRYAGITEIPRENATPGEFNYTANADNIDIAGDITIEDPELGSLELVSGTLLVHYRSLLKEFANGIQSVSTIDDIITDIGPADLDNPLSLGVFIAKTNSTKDIYFAGVPSNDLAGYARILELAGQSSAVYAVVPLTHEQAVLDATKAHVLAMSTEFTKKWRRAVFGVNITESYNVITGSATITADTSVSATHWTKVTFEQDQNLIDNVRMGDTVNYAFSNDAWGNPVFTSGLVDSVESNQVLYLVDPAAGEVTLASSTNVMRTSTDTEFAQRIADSSESYNSERVINVGPTPFDYDGNGTLLPTYYGAAAVGGLMTSVAPQQPMTNSEITGIYGASDTYQRFTETQLNTMAEGGTFLLAQDDADAPVYVRHQLTTAYTQGLLIKSEVSMMTNADNISYNLTSKLEPYVGRYNITPQLLVTLRNVLEDEINNLAGLTNVGLVGPQLISENSEVVSVVQHPTLKDRTVSEVILGIPAPGNVHELHLKL